MELSKKLSVSATICQRHISQETQIPVGKGAENNGRDSHTPRPACWDFLFPVCLRVSRSPGTQTWRILLMLTIEVEREEDGRWIAEVVDLPGVLAYGQTRQEAVERTQALALRVLADRLEHGESVPDMGGVFAVAP